MIFTRRFPELFWRQTLRPALRRPGLSLLTICGVGLGVAVFLAVQVANRAALQSFRASVELAAGRAHLEARGEFDESLFPALRKVEGVRAAAPLVEGIAPLAAPAGEYLRILGVDPLAAPGLFSFRLEGAGGQELDLERWMTQPGMLAVSPEQKRRMKAWGPAEVLTATGRHPVHAAFEMVSDEPLARAEPRLAAMDIGWAQILLGKSGRLTGALFLLEEESRAEEVAARLREILPPSVTVAAPSRRNKELQTMLGAFQLNLTAMSLVSVIVGMFLVYNSVSAAVVRRQPQIAILRACGASRAEVRCLFLGEAAIEGAVGSALGVAAAPWLASALSQPIGRTVASLYELASLDAAALSLPQAALGMAVGLGSALLAAWFPASEAAHVNPAAILHAGAPNRVFAPSRRRLAAGAAAALLLAGLTGWLALRTGPALLGFASAGFVVAAFTMLVPFFASLSARCGRAWGILGRLAADHLERSLHRNGVTIAAMSAAVAMAVAVGVMIHSFRASVVRWT
ncbi:MAG: FtsX-like permease family protein, partial [Terrimicrobiaceae bacterium]|nr:FtsX-like permease family protein [Terrimicrobiaceae bacterium]